MSQEYNWEKAKPFTGSEWPLVGGIKQPSSLCLLSCFLFLISCSLARDSQSPLKPALQSEEFALQDDEVKSPFPHPRQALAWDTQVLLMTEKQPALEDIQNCQAELYVSAKDADQDLDIIRSKNQLMENIKQQPFVYHWCFYHSVHALDSRLQKLGVKLRERSQMFYESMKQLWILARALDAYLDSQEYFRYLQTRYVQLSREVFGRDLSVIGQPVDLLTQPPQDKDPNLPGKAASEAPLDW